MKKITSLLTILMLFMLFIPTMGYANNNSLPITVNGNTIGYGRVINGTTYVPVRELQNIGANVAWDNTTKTATVTYNDSTVSLSLANGIKILNNRSYAILRQLNSLDGIAVSYDAGTKTVLIETTQSIDPNNNSNSDNNSNNSNNNGAVTGEFIREPLPQTVPNPKPDYRDDVRAGRIVFAIEQAGRRNLWEAYDDGTLPYIRIKASMPSVRVGTLTLREIMSAFAQILRLSPTSDERNIPLNLRSNKTSQDYILWSKLAKTGMFQHLIKDDGTIDMGRAVEWSELRKALHIYFTEYMGITEGDLDPEVGYNGKPFNASQFAKCTAEDQEALNFFRSMKLFFGYKPNPNIENPFDIRDGKVDSVGFVGDLQSLTLNYP